MKTQIFIILIAFISNHCYSQIYFEKGYYIDNTNQKTTCLIKNIDWKNNPTEFEYKLSEESEPKNATLESVKEFGVDNISKYIRNTVNIDRSTENINKLNNDKNPSFKEEQLFLKVLIEGKASLYEYIDTNLKRYFYSIEHSNIEQLIFKSFKTNENQIRKNNKFKQQLWTDLNCPNFQMTKIESLDYKKSDLINFFIDYNACYNQQVINFEEKQKKDLFNLTLRPRLNSSSLTLNPNSEGSGLNNSDFNSAVFEDIDFDNEIRFGFGVEAEFILPFNKNKLAIVIEPTYQSFKSEKESNISAAFIGGGVTKDSEIIIEVDYASIEVPLSLRYYFFLNKTSKIFVNVSSVFEINLDSSIKFDVTTDNYYNIPSPPDYEIDDSIPYIFQPLEIESRINWAFGIGYKFQDKYSLEMRYQTNRDLLSENSSWKSEYNTLALILGYTVF
ncbi:tRNA modification GTPase [Formosa undariae]|uniref:tRNA modification GTPase n=1 Tax=Formosa undariae TaxID=1325436 RepID=A0ABV5F0X2_9FLAO